MKKPYYIDYPQEHIEGQAHAYRCRDCKVSTTKINGLLEGHLPDCAYRKRMEQVGYECEALMATSSHETCDDFD